jgi:hypothetical protein
MNGLRAKQQNQMNLVLDFASIIQGSSCDAIRIAVIVFSQKGMDTISLEDKYLTRDSVFECSLSTHIDMAKKLSVYDALDLLVNVNAHEEFEAFKSLARGETTIA